MSRLPVVLSALGLVALALPLASAQRGERPAKPVEEPVPANPAPPPPAPKQADKGAERGMVVERVGVGAASNQPVPVVSEMVKPEVAQMRAVAKQMIRMEQIHRERLARIDRLVEIFGAQKDTEKLKLLSELRAKQEMRYAAAMEGYKKAVGPETYAKIQAAMNAPRAKTAAPDAPTAPAAEGKARRKR
jgi:hypothetical protein